MKHKHSVKLWRQSSVWMPLMKSLSGSRAHTPILAVVHLSSSHHKSQSSVTQPPRGALGREMTWAEQKCLLEFKLWYLHLLFKCIHLYKQSNLKCISWGHRIPISNQHYCTCFMYHCTGEVMFVTLQFTVAYSCTCVCGRCFKKPSHHHCGLN